MSCEHAHLDGAYVLGALSPAERAEFERHLAGCEDCARGVRELAGLPGLLARIPAEVLEGDRRPEPVPETLLPALVAEVRRTRRRQAVRAVTLAAAAVVVVAAGTAGAVTVLDRDEGPDTSLAPPSLTTLTTAPARPMEAVGDASVTGWISLTQVGSGTRLDLVCTYEHSYESPYSPDYGTSASSTYALLVRTTDGRLEQVATWRTLPGQTMQVSGATEAAPVEIASVEVRTGRGVTVLRLSD